MTFGGPFWVTLAVLLELGALLWLLNPKHRRTRALVRVPLLLILGALVRVGILD